MLTSRDVPDLSQIKNIAIGGAGVNGAAYGGMFDMLEKNPTFSAKNIVRLAATSSGALAAVCWMLMKAKGLIQTTLDTNLAELKDDFNPFRLISNYSLYSNNQSRKVLEQLLEKTLGNKDATLNDLKNYTGKSLYIVTTKFCSINEVFTAIPAIFSCEKDDPNRHLIYAANTRVIDLLLASTAIPAIFPPVYLANHGNGCYKQSDTSCCSSCCCPDVDLEFFGYIDGGWSGPDLPLKLFDHPEYYEEKQQDNKNINPETIALYVETHLQTNLSEVKPIPKCKPFTYLSALLAGATTGRIQEILRTDPSAADRTFVADAHGISSRDFDITQQQKKALIEYGGEAKLGSTISSFNFADKPVPVGRLHHKPSQPTPKPVENIASSSKPCVIL
jgi:predicted acylesterase/phospholipase RssA